MTELASPTIAASRLEQAFGVLVLLLGTAAVLPLMAEASGSVVNASGDSRSQALWLVVYVATGILIARHRVAVWASLVSDQALLLLVLLAMTSTLWSAAPEITLRRSIGLAMTVVVAVYLARRFTRAQLLDLILWTLAIVVAASALVAVLLPRYGLDPVHPGAWRGVFVTKNELGRLAAIGAALWLLKAISARRGRAMAIVITLACVAETLKSDSKTSLIVSLAAAAGLSVLPLLRGHPFVAVAGTMFALAGATLASAIAVDHTGALLNALGASSTLTGRTAIWDAVWPSVTEHLWLGHGYSAFWLGPDSPAGAVWSRLGAMPPHAHNGLLDVWLQLGLIGLLAFVVWLALGFRRAWTLMRVGDLSDAWPLLFLILIGISNITESSLLTRNSFVWTVAVAAVAQARIVGREVEAAPWASPEHLLVRAAA